jgi:hypothetical protein
MIKQDMKNNIYKKEYVITKAEYDKVMESYNKCQEDNKDKKYTESQLRDAMEEAMAYSKLRQITEYINSLNKQD